MATRGSALARWQAEHVGALLGAVEPRISTEIVTIDTAADRRLDVPVWEMGGKGVFVKEVQAAVLDGRADIAVHSAKDLPSVTPPGLVLAAVPERGDARDALVGSSLDALAVGATVATGSLRRRVQLADRRPDLSFAGLRGNMARRLEQAPAFGAVVVAAVALQRLGLARRAGEVLAPWAVLPQVGQGALAVECRADDEDRRELLRAVEHGPSRRRVDTERAYLAELGGDCDLPAGAHATAVDGGLVLDVMLASLDGHAVLRHRAVGDDPGPLGAGAARHLLDRGGRALLHGAAALAAPAGT